MLPARSAAPEGARWCACRWSWLGTLLGERAAQPCQGAGLGRAERRRTPPQPCARLLERESGDHPQLQQLLVASAQPGEGAAGGLRLLTLQHRLERTGRLCGSIDANEP